MWKTLSSRIVHKNNWYRIVKKVFVTLKGIKGDYYIMEGNGTSFVIPVKGKNIVMIKQYRYPINVWTWEIPGGSIKDGSNYLRTAKDELEEEVGYKAGNGNVWASFILLIVLAA